jgi:hypothetical protein
MASGGISEFFREDDRRLGIVLSRLDLEAKRAWAIQTVAAH